MRLGGRYDNMKMKRRKDSDDIRKEE